MADLDGSSTPVRGTWSGTGGDGQHWEIEVEPDRMTAWKPLAVTVWGDTPGDGSLGELTPTQAREMAAVLLACADHVEAANAREVGNDDA